MGGPALSCQSRLLLTDPNGTKIRKVWAIFGFRLILKRLLDRARKNFCTTQNAAAPLFEPSPLKTTSFEDLYARGVSDVSAPALCAILLKAMSAAIDIYPSERKALLQFLAVSRMRIDLFSEADLAPLLATKTHQDCGYKLNE